MYCEQCGKYNEEGKKYCYNCGSPLIRLKKAKTVVDKAPKADQSKDSYPKTVKTAETEKTITSREKSPENVKTAENMEKSRRSKKRRTDSATTESVKKIPEEKDFSEAVSSDPKSEETEKRLKNMEEELNRLDKSKSPVIALIAALLVFAAALAALFILVPKYYGAKQDAEGFEAAMLSGNWEEAYSYLNMSGETSSFLSAEMFEKVMARSGATGFRNLTVEEEGIQNGEKVFSATYETSEGTKTDYISMCKTGKKKLLFLNEWKVDPDTVTVSNVTITIPSEATLLLNGLEPETEGTVNEEEHALEYSFSKLFAGIWEVELQAENRAPYDTDIDISDEVENGVVSLSGTELSPDQALVDTVLNQFTQDYQAILEASVNRADFSTVEKYFAAEAIQDGRAQNMYANACSQAYDPERGTGIRSYQLSDISATAVPIVKSGYAQEGDLVLEIQSTLTCSYVDDGGEEKSETQTSTGLLCYHQEDGQWKIQSFS